MSYGFKNELGQYIKVAGKGGDGSSTDYTELENKPRINNVELSGNKSADDLGLYTKEETDEKNAVSNKSINDNWQGDGYNLIPYPYEFSSITRSDVEWVVHEDGSVDGTGLDSGTFLQTSSFYCMSNLPTIEGKRYRLSGCPIGGEQSSNGYYVLASGIDSNGDTVDIEGAADIGEGAIFTVPSDVVKLRVVLRTTNKRTDTITFKPMLVEVTNDGTYPTEYQRYGYGNITLSGKADDLYEKVNNRKRLDLPLENLIPQDADLNDYADIGEYCNPYSAVSATLLNCPVSSSGFRLTVEKLYSDEPTQTLESYSGIIYKRTYNSSASAWLDWRKVTLDGSPILIPVNPSTTPTTEGAIWIEIV